MNASIFENTPTPASPSTMNSRKRNKNLIIILFILVFLILASGVVALVFIFFSPEPPLSSRQIPQAPAPSGIPRAAIERRITYTGDIPVINDDLNLYLKSKNRPLVTEHEIKYIDQLTLKEKLESDDPNITIIDIREARETEALLRLNDYPRPIRYIRFGDLINNKFTGIPENSEIIILGFTENRESVAANYLLGEGYQNVSILKGGLLQWALNLLPTSINRYTGEVVVHNDINAILPYIENPDPSATILKFGNFAPDNITLLVMDTESLNDYINSLPKDKKYVLFCEENKFCYEASHFWYVAKDSIDIIGYTGFDDYLPLPNQ